MSFSTAFNDSLLIEKGYSDHPFDAGGKTMYGITEHVARANGYTGEMRDFSADEIAAAIRDRFSYRE